MRNCKGCGKQVLAKDSRTVFCTVSCASSFNNKRRKPMAEISKARLSISLRRAFFEGRIKGLSTEQATINGMKATLGRFKEPKSVMDMSKRTMVKIFKRLKIGCSRCGWNEAICDVHHIWGRKVQDANNHDKLTYICPNCHRLVHSNKIKPDDLIPLTKQIGNRWKDFYFGSVEGKRLLLGV